MNDQEQSDPALKDELKQQNSIDSNGSDSSSSQVKIILIKDKNDDSNLLNNETNNDNIVNEQRESVIVQPTRPNLIAETTAKKPKIDNKDETNNSTQITKDERPKFFIESKFSPSVINNLVNAVTKETANTKLRPSVLRIGDSSSTNDDKNIDSTNKDEQIKVQPFKFAPLTDNKKPSFGNLNSSSIVSSTSILPTNSSLSGLNSSIFTSSSNSTPTFTTFKNSFLSTNNGDSKVAPTSTNYFTENLFQVASTSNNSPESTSTFTISSNKESTGFVFGQNLQDRVTNIVEKPKQTVDLNSSTINQTDSTTNIPLTSTSSTTLNNQTATACIPEKRKFENITGEEEETNVIHIYCKLFHWDSNLSVWKERGKGNLRLNDKYEEERTSSRLIMRTAGSLKLILNCLIQSGMKFELTNESSCIRFSNVDGIYLIKGKPMDIEQIYPLIEQRLKQLPKKSRAESKDVEDGLEIKERLKLDKDDDDDESLNTSNTSNREAEESFKSTESTNKEEDNDDEDNDDEENKDDEDNDDNDEENKNDDDDNKEEEEAKNNNDENKNDGANDENKEIKSNEETVKEKVEIDAENKEINKQEDDNKKSDETNQES